MLSIFLLFNNCVNSDGLQQDDMNNINFNYDYGNTVNRDFYGSVLDRAGNPVSGVSIAIGSSSVTTNSQGFFILNNVSVKEKFAYIKASKAGFVNASRVVVPTNSKNRINIMMIPATVTATISTGSISTVSLSDGTKVKFDGSFKDANGNTYSGNVQVALFGLKTSDTYFQETMPGSLLASDSNGNSKILESYGMMHVQLTGNAGQNLQLANGHTAEITFPVDASQSSTAPSTIPLWSFDENLGIWKQEGTATKNGNVYVGNVAHFSWWNCDYPYGVSTLNVTVNSSSGQALSGVQVGISLPSQVYPNTITTNANGTASGLVPANQNLVLEIFDQCGNVIYTSNIGSYAVGSVNNVTAVVSNTTVQAFTITGTLQNCSGNNVTNGMVQLTTNTSNLFSNNIQLVNNGTFSFTTIACNSTQQFSLIGYDYDNLQTSGSINYTATVPNTNVGVISTCNAVSEFISYQIDNQPPKVCLSNISAGSDITPNGTYSSVYAQGNNIFGFNYQGLLSTGLVLTNNYNLTLSSATPGTVNTIAVNGTTNAITFTVNSFGAVGSYIDFTFSGTFVDATGSHTISGTGHVIRDF